MTLLAEVVYTASVGVQTYTITFPFLQQDHVRCSFDGDEFEITTDYTINPAGTELTLVNPVPTSGRLVIYRETPKLDTQRLVDFTDGSAFTALDLDTSALQLLYIAQEIQDDATNALRLAADGTDVWDAQNKRITSLGAPSALTDAARLQDLQDVAAGSGNLPLVTVAQNDHGLHVEAGVWSTRTPAECREHLGLGTAALLDTGEDAGEIPVLDAQGLPAVSGENLDLSANDAIESLELTKHRVPTMVAQINNLNPVPNYQLPANTWQTDLGTRVTFTAAPVVWDDDGSMTAGAGFITLAAGTYLVEFSVDVINTDTAAGQLQQIIWGVFNGNTGLSYIGPSTYIDIPPAVAVGVGVVEGRLRISRKRLVTLASPADLNLRVANYSAAASATCSIVALEQCNYLCIQRIH